jgi:hypothetical protein
MTMTTTCAGGVGEALGLGAARGRPAELDTAAAQAERSKDETTSKALQGRTGIDPA